MQDQGKRLLLAVALALGVMLVWNVVFPSKKADEPPPQPPQTAGETLPVASSQVGLSTEPTPEPAVEAAAGEPITLSFPDRFDATFSSRGGTLVSFKLADARFHHDRDGKSAHKHGELLPVDPTTEQPLPDTGAFGVNFARSTYVLPAGATWRGEKLSDTQVRYSISTAHLDVTKTFTILPEVYLVRMVVSARVKVPAGKIADQTLAITSYAFQDPDKIEGGQGRGETRAWVSSTLRRGEDATVVHTPITSVIKAPRMESNIRWTGFEHPYLLTAYAPKLEPGETVEKWTFSASPKGLMRTDLLFGSSMLKDNAPEITKEVVAYLGPKNYKSLEAADEAAGFETGFKETIDLGWFAFIGKPLLWLLLKFYAFFGNWGIAIILLTFLVKAATLYWTTKSMRSMKSMAALAPQMKLLQEKYKEDRQRLQAETMALYKTHNVNPIAGCLPILLQMPIWLALYRMLSSAGELYQQPFIHGWIDDLTATDPYHILPFVLVATMFLQARLTPVTGDSRQQKLMQYGMPLMFGVMSFFFPAGLTLYIFTNTVLSALHSIYMNKFDKKSIEVAARMRKASEEAAAKDVAAAKPAGGKPAKNGQAKPPSGKPKPVIDVVSTETDDDEAGEETAAETAGSAPAAAVRPRSNKRKKRRR